MNQKKMTDFALKKVESLHLTLKNKVKRRTKLSHENPMIITSIRNP